MFSNLAASICGVTVIVFQLLVLHQYPRVVWILDSDNKAAERRRDEGLAGIC